MQKNLTSSPQIAAPEAGRGAAPHIFAATLAYMVGEAENILDNSAPEDEISARRRLGVLRLAAGTTLPFPRFCDELYQTAAPEVAESCADMLDTLSALWHVCTGKEA